MRREGSLHGYGFDREQRHARVKALKQAPSNRPKFGAKGSAAAEKAGRFLKKAKSQRNKAFGADVVANHRMHEGELRVGPHRTSNLHLPHDTTADAVANAASSLLFVDMLSLRHFQYVSRCRPSSLESGCGPREPDHGYFDREQQHVRVQVLKQAPATNRSKFGAKGSAAAEKAGRPSSKSLKKAKGQRNKGFGADVVANHRMYEWELRVGPHRTSTLHPPHDTTADADANAASSLLLVDMLGLRHLHVSRRRPSSLESSCGPSELDHDHDEQDDDWFDLGLHVYDEDWCLVHE